MIARLLRIRRILAQTVGERVRPLLALPLLAVHRLTVVLGWALDPWVWPGLRAHRTRPPIFVIGNPRSGTTFLHRWLVRQGFGAGFQLWQLLWPALTPRPLVRPLLGLLERVSPARFHGTVAHPTSLTSVETDDAMLFFRFGDGLFGWGYFLAWDEEEHDDELDARLRERAPRDFAFLAEAQRRNSLWHARDRAVGKLFSATLRPRETLDAFPEARFLYLVRDPVEVIPSGLSLVLGVLGRAYDLGRVPPATKARFVRRLYRASILMYRRMADAFLAGELPPDRVHVVRYDRLMTDFAGEMRAIADFVGQPVDEALRAAMDVTAGQQARWESAHRYRPEDFGLTAEEIRTDTAFVYEVFGVPSGE